MNNTDYQDDLIQMNIDITLYDKDGNILVVKPQDPECISDIFDKD